MTPEARRTKYARALAEHDFNKMEIDLTLLTEDHPFWEIYLQVADVAIRLADEELHEAAEKQRAIPMGAPEAKRIRDLVADAIDPKLREGMT